MKLKAIIFDFDGVIVDSVGIKILSFAEVFKDICDPLTVAYIHEYNKNKGAISRYIKFDYCFEHFIGREPKEGEIEELSKKYTKLTMERIIKANYTEGALEFIKNHYKDMDLYIATATPPDDIEKIIDAKGIGKYFKEIIGTKSSKVPILKKIADNYEKDEIIYIGDFHTDLEAAKEADMNFIAYGDPINGADMYIKNMKCLEMII